MSYLYRHALFVSRKRPYLDWANGLNDGGPGLSEDVSLRQRTVYLVPELDREPDLGCLLDEFWEDIFHEKLASWSLKDESWPTIRTRDMFDRWFDVELNASLYNLTPEEPLTQPRSISRTLQRHRDDARRVDLTWNKVRVGSLGSSSSIEAVSSGVRRSTFGR
jgi:hypothetical protein